MLTNLFCGSVSCINFLKNDLARGFKIYIVGPNYHRAVRYANEIGADISLIHEIEEDAFNYIIENHVSEKLLYDDYEDYEENDKNKYNITSNDINKFDGTVSRAILEKANWE